MFAPKHGCYTMHTTSHTCSITHGCLKKYCPQNNNYSKPIKFKGFLAKGEKKEIIKGKMVGSLT